MAPVANCSTSNFCVQPRIPYTLRNESNVKRTKFHGEVRRPILVPVCPPFSWSLSLQFSQNVRVKPLRHKSKFQIFTTLGTDAVVVEDADSTAAVGDSTLDDETSSSVSIDPPVSVQTGGDASSKPRVVASSSPPVKRARPGRKSDMPPLKNEDLVPGAAFTGKVRSIHPFGAFVDIGAFTDGLVHVSRLSDSFVKDVAEVVSIGQEVTVKIVEANMETGRISLSMRERDDAKNQQQRRRDTNSTTAVKSEDRPSEQDRSRTPMRTRNSAPRREFKQKPSNFVQGEILEGTVKKLTRSGAIISLPEGEEGFLPSTEEADVYGSILGSSSLQVDQEVSVRVLRISRGAATLTMKTEEKVKDGEIIAQGVVYKATNPFELAFRKNKVIASFLDERDRAQKPPETKSESVDIQPPTGTELSVDTKVLEDGTLLPTTLESVAAEQTDLSSSATDLNIDAFTPQEVSLAALKKHDTTSEEVVVVTAAEDPTLSLASNNTAVLDDKEEMPSVDAMLVGEASIIEAKDNQPETVVEGTMIGEVSISSTLDKGDGDAATMVAAAAGQDPDLSLLSTDALPELQAVMPVGGASISKTGTSSTLDKIEEDTITISTEASETTATQDSISATLSDVVDLVAPTEEKGDSIEGGVVGSADVLAESNSSSLPSLQEETVESAFSTPEKEKVEVSAATDTDAANVNELVVASEEIANASKSDLSADTTVVEEKVILTFAAFEDEKVTEPIQLEEVHEGDGNNVGNGAASIEDIDEGSLPNTDMGPIPLYEEQEVMAALNGTSSSNSSNEAETKAVVSPALVKQLREETGAGMMDCKKALAETDGDIIKAQEFLRKKGLAGAEKKFSRVTAEGRIGSYIHDNRIGVMIEVNCETDFVSRGEIFKELVDDLAMQVAACTQVEYLSTEDVPGEIVNKEREIEMQKEDLMKKPEQIRGRIVEGRIKKRLEELALLEQPFIKDDKLVVKDLVKQKISTIGENIKVRRFIKYVLGEGLQKKSQDFAAEVAAQTASKMAPAPPKAEPTPNAEKSVEEKKPAAAISAALVKQLREDTGAGMMDCKKALSETDGDLEKAQEYLRKKGLSSAEKKSGRLAAEGRIGSYIHDNRIGVLIEVNCETDFVARGEIFKQLVDDLAMQIVACPQVEFVSIEDVPESIVKKEKELEMQREDLQSKPEDIRERIVEGRIMKRLGELALLEQPFIKDDKLLIKDLVKQAVVTLGENVKVRRFTLYNLGQGN